MKNKIKNITCVSLSVVVVLVSLALLSKSKPFAFDLPVLNLQEIEQQEEAQKKAAQASAERAQLRKIYHCQADEDCVIVEKDPCGCWVGPSGVTAINAEQALEFDKFYPKNVTKTCPDTAPSIEKECSLSARAVCRNNACKIEY